MIGKLDSGYGGATYNVSAADAGRKTEDVMEAQFEVEMDPCSEPPESLVEKTPEPGKMSDASHVIRFVTAGNSTFTIVSQKTGTRFTYKVKASDDGKIFFVKVLTGSNNEGDYEYLGTIRETDDYPFSHGRKSRIAPTASSSKAFAWFWKKLHEEGEIPSNCDFHHAGRCGRCGRKLTVPESIQTGLGPECASRTE